MTRRIDGPDRSCKSDSARSRLEDLIAADLRAITLSSSVIRPLAGGRRLRGNDLRALLHITQAEAGGNPLTSSRLRQYLQFSPAAISYLVDRIVAAGYIRRETDPFDRRKLLLRTENSAKVLDHDSFAPLGADVNLAVADLSDDALLAAHQVMGRICFAMADFEGELRGRPEWSDTDAPAEWRPSGE